MRIRKEAREEVRKEEKPMRPILAYLGLLLAFLVLVFGFVHIAEEYLFVLLSISVILIGTSLVSGR